MLTATVSRGKNKGMRLVPHVQDGCHIVSFTRFEKDYVRVPVDQPLDPHLRKGMSLRMSPVGLDVGASLITPSSIAGWSRVPEVDDVVPEAASPAPKPTARGGLLSRLMGHLLSVLPWRADRGTAARA